MWWKPETKFRESLGALPHALTGGILGTGLVSFTAVMTIPAPMVMQAAAAAGWTASQTAAWLFAVFVAGGLMQLALVLGYRQPLAAGASTVATALLVSALPGFAIEEAVGGFAMHGALILGLTVTGVYSRLLETVPREVVFGMLAGALLSTGSGILEELLARPWLAGAIVAAWLGCWRRQRIPPMVAALLTASLLVFLGDRPDLGAVPWTVTWPSLHRPVFTWSAFVSLSLPLTLVVLGSQNPAALAVLWGLGYRPPVRAASVATGVFTLTAALLGGPGVSLGAQRAAIAGEPRVHPEPAMRYAALVVDALLLLAVAALASSVVALFQLFPATIIRTVAGLAVLPAVLEALPQAFAPGVPRLGALVALLVASSSFRWLGISAVFWSLMLGWLATTATRLGESRSAPGSPGPDERGGLRGAPRLCRGAPSVRGFGGPGLGPPSP